MSEDGRGGDALADERPERVEKLLLGRQRTRRVEQDIVHRANFSERDRILEQCRDGKGIEAAAVLLDKKAKKPSILRWDPV